MPDREQPTYRYWGTLKPTALAPVASTAAPAGGRAQMRLYGPIDDWGQPFGVSAQNVADALDALPDGVNEIELHIHSPGGMAFEGLAIMNLLRQHPAKVEVVVDGLCASAASIVAMGADRVVMVPGAQMMIHDASGICVGTAEDMQTMFTRLDKLSANYAEQYAAKAGGKVADWRDAMLPESWYSAAEAVEAGLADEVLDKAPDAAPEAAFDLSIFAHAGRDNAPTPPMPAKASTQTPAEPPVHVPTQTEEAVTMTPEDMKALRERLGLAEDASFDAITAKLDELEEAATKPAPPAAAAPPAEVEVTDEAVAAYLEKTGKTVVSQVKLDELTSMAADGAEARAKQREQERDDAIEAAFKAGKISAERRDAWKASWDKDPEGTKADLDSLEARFPVAATTGYAGSDASDGDGAVFNDDEAAALAALTGTTKEALLNG